MIKLKIRDDLVQEGLAVPVLFLDSQESKHIEHSDTLDIQCEYTTNGEELSEDGYNTIVKISDPSMGWNNRLAFCYSVDYETK